MKYGDRFKGNREGRFSPAGVLFYPKNHRRNLNSTMLIAVIIGVLILFGIALKLTGAFLKAVLWLCVKLPIGILLCVLGIVLCCTILGIKLGLKCLKKGIQLILPI